MMTNRIRTNDAVDERWIDRLNRQLREIRDYQAEGKDQEAVQAIEALVAETYDSNAYKYNWNSPLCRLVIKNCSMLERRYGLSAANREDVMQDVICWIMDGTLLKANNRDNLVNYISGKIAFNPENANNKSINRDYGITVYKNNNKRCCAILETSERIADDGEIYNIADTKHANVIGCNSYLSPEEYIDGDYYEEMKKYFSKAIIKVVICTLVKRKYDVDAFIRYCVDYEVNKGIVHACDYGDVDKVWNSLRRQMPCIIKKFEAEISREDVPVSLIENFINTLKVWNNNGSGARDIIRICFSKIMSDKRDLSKWSEFAA